MWGLGVESDFNVCPAGERSFCQKFGRSGASVPSLVVGE